MMKAAVLQFLITATLAHCQFSIEPESVVQAEGLEAVFECLYPGARTHNWVIQGVFFADTSFPPDVRRDLPSGGSPARLTIPATQKYNNTIIQCNAVVENTNRHLLGMFSNNATLLVQGRLQAVADLHFDRKMSSNTTITILWEAPFSLNLTTAEPDIQYCVDVYNVTGGGDDLNQNAFAMGNTTLLSECLTETMYSYNPPNPLIQHLFCFEVTAVSNVPGALNRSSIRYVHANVLLKPNTIPSQLLTYHTNADLSSIKWTFPSSVVLVSPRSLSIRYRVELESIDDPEHWLVCSCLARTEDTNDNLNTLTLQWCRRIHNYTITVTNEAGSSTSEPARLSTHDVQNLQVQLLKNHTNHDIAHVFLEVTCSFLAGSTPSGILVIAYSLTNTSNVHYVVGERTGNQTRVIIDELRGDVYNVVVYDRGEDQLPEERPAGSQTVDDVQEQHYLHGLPYFPLLPAPEVTFMEGEGRVCARCLLTPLLNACVVIAHSAHENALEQQLRVYLINRSDVSECFLIDQDEFSIAVFGLLHDGLERTPAFVNLFTVNTSDIGIKIYNNAPVIIAVVGSSSLLFLTLSLCLPVTGIVIWKRNRGLKQKVQNNREQVSTRDTFPEIEQPNEAYNFVNTFTTNEAYSMVEMTGTPHLSPRPLPTPSPAPVHGVHTPSPPHIYEEPRLKEPTVEKPAT